MPSPTGRKKKRQHKSRDAEKGVFRIKLPGKRNKEPKVTSQEPLTPYYHKCTSKCKTCSTGSCSGSDSSPVLQVIYLSNITTTICTVIGLVITYLSLHQCF